jgi:hypothetical protein
MPFISIPTKARDRYIELCHRARDAKTEQEYKRYCTAAQYYGDAIQDLCGSTVAGYIFMEADLTYPENAEVCVGIPLFYKDKAVKGA